ncbi:PREDICTED: uncharacterized protein LOC109356923 [Lupinus angustifolius]|uniref:uncharacterized protein LOC109356923 n=1 Tax=Lupinus angustifolius TaxID=3871 RepID=UPI00092F3BAA|nr:PREDICTED: uncharacterized protein LOC109356923 [Lupinus angustifolius]XP_019456103.1 PREDICTED: uncharacterized protein LOC109356923 [Lupinus angustifolius]
MEALYLKLHDRYTKLKTKKLSELDQLSKEQEVKFMNYLTASEELIEHLKSENDKLHEELNELRSEVGSIRIAKDKQVAEYQKLLMEESKKNEALSEEVEKLRKLQLEITSGDLNNNSKIMAADHQLRATSNSSSRKMTRKRMLQEGTSGNLNDNSMVIAENDHFGSISNTPSRRMTRSRRKQDEQEKEARFIISYENSEGSAVARQSTENVSKDTTSAKLLEFCTEANDQSGLQKTDNCNWLIQALFEYALGMKLSTDHQTEQICLSALHQSSGYSFSLTWICKSPEEEAELLYHVQSLGTFERVAPEWMREDIMFSPTMCPIFFERVSRVIKLNH